MKSIYRYNMIKKVLSFAFFMGLVSCSEPARDEAAQPLGVADASPTAALKAEACKGTDSFAVQVFSMLAAGHEGNVVFSPASLEAVLRLLQQGARGATATELAALPMGKTGIRTAMTPAEANALFVSERLTLNPGVRADEVLKVPFATAPDKAASIINRWADSKTQGLIPSIVSPRDISPTTALVAANAIYLKEKWLHPFPAASTRENADFTLENGNTVHVSLMRSKAKYHYAEGPDWCAVALPYKTEGRKGEPGYFIGILPRGNARDFARQLTPRQYQDIRKALVSNAVQETIVLLPRFELNPGTYSLKPALQACGVKNIFSQHADLRGFCNSPIYLDDVLQRCYVETDEEGTKAAAVTVAVVQCKSISPGPRPKVIAFDRPFIWVIGDLNTPAAPCFMGITQHPQSK